MQNESGSEKKFVFSLLPWVVAAAAFIVYLLTLNPWMSLANMSNATRLAGQSWQPEFHGPLYYLATFPLRWLPASKIPLAVNLFSAICAALTLALLARSVVLLPHDRTGQQRLRSAHGTALLNIRLAWIPPVLAVLACGLQLTFWECATSGSSDMALFHAFGSDQMFTMLLFAYVVRCLLEYRISKSDSWLLRGALVWGAATANSWMIFCFFFAFIIAVLWVKGLEFFNIRFLSKMLVCGTVGLLLYVLLPILYIVSDNPMLGFWESLKVNLVFDKSSLVHFFRGYPLYVLLLTAVTSFVPVLVIAIRWASNFGDPSRFGNALTTWTFHLVHGALLGACVWVILDPVFSPRHRDIPFPMLYYLSALSIGYFSGYFLLVFAPLQDRFRPAAVWQLWLYRVSRTAVWILLFLLPAGLVWRNLPQIRITNGPAMRQFTDMLGRNLPQRGVILSDDRRRLFLAEAWLAKNRSTKDYYFLDTRYLELPSYHYFQQKRHPDGWPALVNVKSAEKVDSITLISIQARLAEKNPICYLHPSFGYYFEYFYAQPRGLSLELKGYPTNSVFRPTLTQAEVNENEQFWNDAQPLLKQLSAAITPPRRGTNLTIGQKLLGRLHLPFETNMTALALASFFSQAENTWGVELQRAGHLGKARRHFQSAINLNGYNIAATENLKLNDDLQAGRKPKLRMPKSFEDELGVYRNWQRALPETGPFDGPTYCFGQGVISAQNNLLRQAAQQFERVRELVPDNLQVRVLLARLYVVAGLPEKACQLMEGIDPLAETLDVGSLSRLDLIQVKAASLLAAQQNAEVTAAQLAAQTNSGAAAAALLAARKNAEADRFLQDAMQANSSDTNILSMIVQLAARAGRVTNALAAINLQLQIMPDDPATLWNKAALEMKIGNFSGAIPMFTRVLTIQSNNYNALLARAFSYVEAGQFDEGQRDYEDLRKYFPTSIDVNTGLAEIYWRRHETNSAIHYYELALTNSNPNPKQLEFINERLKSLKGAPP